MSQSGDTPPLALPPASTKSKGRRLLFLGFAMVVSMILGASALTILWYKVREEQAWNVPVQNTVDTSRLTDLEEKIRTVEGQLNALSERLENVELAKPVEPADEAAPRTTGMSAEAANDIALLKAEIAALQAQLKQTTQTADQIRNAALSSQNATQTSLGAIVALTQARAVASTGEGFAREWQMLRQFAGNDAVLQETLKSLEPMAAKGAPSLPLLRESFTALSDAAQAAAHKAEAQDWVDRLLTALRGLVSIRPLHPVMGEADLYGAIESDLAHHRLATALEKESNLPQAARDVLKDWRGQAESRLLLESLFTDVAEHLVPRPAAPATLPQEP